MLIILAMKKLFLFLTLTLSVTLFAQTANLHDWMFRMSGAYTCLQYHLPMCKSDEVTIAVFRDATLQAYQQIMAMPKYQVPAIREATEKLFRRMQVDFDAYPKAADDDAKQAIIKDMTDVMQAGHRL